MISINDLFAQFGGGREGWWREAVWKRVLEVLSTHDGEPYAPTENRELFDDLEAALEPIDPTLSPRGQADDRSVFRAAAGAWTGTGVVSLDDGKIAVTDAGRAVIAGSRSYADCLKFLFIHYRERRNGRNPFIPILRELSAKGTSSFDQLFDAVQDETGPAMKQWRSTAKLQGFPYEVAINSGNPSRSVRFLLALLVTAGLVANTDGNYTIEDTSGAEHMLKQFRETFASGDSNTGAGLGITSTIDRLSDAGWQFQPWQIATFCFAVKTKPFVILAGISGTGKSKLPALVAEATGAHFELVPVKPDWRDSSDLLGYLDLAGKFHPGVLLLAARRAIDDPTRQHFLLLDEMNLARVEYYLAEVLSLIEDRKADSNDGYRTQPMLAAGLSIRDEDQEDGMAWGDIYLPANLAILGSVNMDETTHGFSRKVLDRAFVLEFSDVNLSAFRPAKSILPEAETISASEWRSTATRLAEHPDSKAPLVDHAIAELEALNLILSKSQLQVGYRLRDEVALFLLEARTSEGLTTQLGEVIDPLDLVLSMKVLPRIQGGGARIKEVLRELREWASPKGSVRLPLCANRIELLESRLAADGFTSYWL